MGNKRPIYDAGYLTIQDITRDLDSSYAKKQLAELRNSIGRDELPITTLSLVFEYLPDRFLGKGGQLTAGENSLIKALQLFSIHQQGNETIVHNTDLDSKSYEFRLGSAFHTYKKSVIQKNGESQSLDRRFNIMITSTHIDELFNHLRHLIKIASKEVRIDYAQLAEDMYWFQRGYENDIRLKWSRQYYRSLAIDNEKENINE